MWQAIDTAGNAVEPGPVPTNSDLAVLVGRPVALVQVAVRLELEGAPRLDLSFDNLGNDSDAGLTGIQFPVIVGDLTKLSDGLIGYFTQTGAGRRLRPEHLLLPGRRPGRPFRRGPADPGDGVGHADSAAGSVRSSTSRRT